jgi:hypothetical protein
MVLDSSDESVLLLLPQFQNLDLGPPHTILYSVVFLRDMELLMPCLLFLENYPAIELDFLFDDPTESLSDFDTSTYCMFLGLDKFDTISNNIPHF